MSKEIRRKLIKIQNRAAKNNKYIPLEKAIIILKKEEEAAKEKK